MSLRPYRPNPLTEEGRAYIRLKESCDVLRAQITRMREALHRKNVELDALRFVWCDGGCESGTHRWSEQTITEEVVQEAERNTRRLRAWFENHKSRAARAGQRTCDG